MKARFKAEYGGAETVDAIKRFFLTSAHGARLSFEELEDGQLLFEIEHRRLAFSLADLMKALGMRVAPVSSATAVVINEQPSAQDYVAIVDRLIAEKVAEYGYDSIVSACSYATSTVPKFRREGQAFSKWRDIIWTACFSLEEQAKVTGRWPALEDTQSLLPSFEAVLDTMA